MEQGSPCWVLLHPLSGYIPILFEWCENFNYFYGRFSFFLAVCPFLVKGMVKVPHWRKRTRSSLEAEIEFEALHLSFRVFLLRLNLTIYVAMPVSHTSISFSTNGEAVTVKKMHIPWLNTGIIQLYIFDNLKWHFPSLLALDSRMRVNLKNVRIIAIIVIVTVLYFWSFFRW
jgi:hypothetical protein